MLLRIRHQLEAAEFARVMEMQLTPVCEADHDAVMRVRMCAGRFQAELSGHAQVDQEVPAGIQLCHNVLGAPRQPADHAPAQGARERIRRFPGDAPVPVHLHVADARALQAGSTQPPHHSLHLWQFWHGLASLAHGSCGVQRRVRPFGVGCRGMLKGEG